MSKVFVGVDGCKGGWFAIALTENGDPEANCFRNISDLWDKYKKASRILIDIPIGLRDKGDVGCKEERKCDKEARARLKPPLASCVFPAPCRTAVYKAATYEKTSNVNKQVTGKGLTKQTFAIIPKIRDVDDFLHNNKRARSRISETHPEICFWGLNGGQSMTDKKKSPKGREQRTRKLKAFCPQTNRIIEYVKSKYKRKEVAIDDILDALAAAVTARLGYKDKFKTLPEKPEKDSQHLPMEIVYSLYKK